MHKERKIDQIIDDYEKLTTGRGGLERALYNLLRDNQDKLPEFDHEFHRRFRLTGVIDDLGYVDSAIWCLLDASVDFWVMIQDNGYME